MVPRLSFRPGDHRALRVCIAAAAADVALDFSPVKTPDPGSSGVSLSLDGFTSLSQGNAAARSVGAARHSYTFSLPNIEPCPGRFQAIAELP